MYVPPWAGTVGGRPGPTPSGAGGTSMWTNSQQRGRWSAVQPVAASSELSWSIRNCNVLPPDPPRPTTQILYTGFSRCRATQVWTDPVGRSGEGVVVLG